jgi:hypothetical protein
MKIVETFEGAGVAATLIMRDFISRRESFPVHKPGLVRGRICRQLPSFIGHDRSRGSTPIKPRHAFPEIL